MDLFTFILFSSLIFIICLISYTIYLFGRPL